MDLNLVNIGLYIHPQRGGVAATGAVVIAFQDKALLYAVNRQEVEMIKVSYLDFTDGSFMDQGVFIQINRDKVLFAIVSLEEKITLGAKITYEAVGHDDEGYTFYKLVKE